MIHGHQKPLATPTLLRRGRGQASMVVSQGHVARRHMEEGELQADVELLASIRGFGACPWELQEDGKSTCVCGGRMVGHPMNGHSQMSDGWISGVVSHVTC